MIPRLHIAAWQRQAPWADDAQVEQDLVLSRILVELFRRPTVACELAFRGGTALHKLYFDPPGRYSEDIDLVQRQAGPIGPVVNDIRDTLDSWLGSPQWRAGRDRFTLYYTYEPTGTTTRRPRVKIEINTCEHFATYGIVGRVYELTNPWFSGKAEVVTYRISELLGTKLRALYQRKKGRDLFDLAMGLDHPKVDVSELVSAFERYLESGGNTITRERMDANLESKLKDHSFRGDVAALLRDDLVFDPDEAWRRVRAQVLPQMRSSRST